MKNKRLENILYILCISVLAALGVFLIHLKISPIGPTSTVYKKYGSFNEALIHWAVITFLGLVIFYSVKLYNERTGADSNNDYICPSCEDAKRLYLKNNEETLCDKCNTIMVSLKGYYDRK